MKTILLLEDDIEIAREIDDQLTETGFLVTHVKTIAQTKTIDFSKFDVLIFDWNLPDGDSIQLVNQIRSCDISVPILMLSANTDTQYRDKALRSGANDFLGKPFYFHELKARLELLQKVQNKHIHINNTLENSGIKVIKNEMVVTYNGTTLELANKEFDLIVFFLTNPGTVFTRNEILDAVWGADEMPSPRTVDNHILNLRKKTDPKLFQTVWNRGYKFQPKDNA